MGRGQLSATCSGRPYSCRTLSARTRRDGCYGSPFGYLVEPTMKGSHFILEYSGSPDETL